MSCRRFRIHPLEYYKLRNSGEFPEIIYLKDEYGEDRRYPNKVNETYLFSKQIGQYEEVIKKHISNGAKLIELAKQTEAEKNPFIEECYLEKWEIISGLKQVTNWNGFKRPICEENYIK